MSLHKVLLSFGAQKKVTKEKRVQKQGIHANNPSPHKDRLGRDRRPVLGAALVSQKPVDYAWFLAN